MDWRSKSPIWGAGPKFFRQVELEQTLIQFVCVFCTPFSLGREKNGSRDNQNQSVLILSDINTVMAIYWNKLTKKSYLNLHDCTCSFYSLKYFVRFRKQAVTVLTWGRMVRWWFLITETFQTSGAKLTLLDHFQFSAHPCHVSHLTISSICLLPVNGGQPSYTWS